MTSWTKVVCKGQAETWLERSWAWNIKCILCMILVHLKGPRGLNNLLLSIYLFTNSIFESITVAFNAENSFNLLCLSIKSNRLMMYYLSRPFKTLRWKSSTQYLRVKLTMTKIAHSGTADFEKLATLDVFLPCTPTSAILCRLSTGRIYEWRFWWI